MENRSHSGTAFSVLVTRTVAEPLPGSDEIRRAFEEGWVGGDGYRKADGTHQKRALAFLGEVVSAEGEAITEVFLVDLPDDVTVPGEDGPLEGTETRRPAPPRGTRQRRLTFTADRRYPGVQGPRHWVRSSPDGSQIAFLMRDDAGLAQIWTVSPNGGDPRQVTRDPWGVASAFSWSPDGSEIAYIADNSVFVIEVAAGQSRRLTRQSSDADAPLPLACVFSPDGLKIAYQRRLAEKVAPDALRYNQIFTVASRA
jgi:dipeptidyl aminopeptidase/acylaminoacyl peptidase